MSEQGRVNKLVGGYEIHLEGRGRQFKSDFLERFSSCHGLTPLVFYIPVIGICLYYAITDTPLGAGSIFAYAVAGVFFWTFAEYMLHRFFFHWKRYPKFNYFIHGIHHVYPNDRGRMVMPPGASISLAVPLWFLSLVILGYVAALPFFAGFVVGYLWYDMTHFWTHVGKPKSRWGKLIRRQHMLHHFHTPGKNFGVTSPAWDIVFRTYQPRQK